MSLIHQLSDQPLFDLRTWIEHASKEGIPDANAMSLATATRDGRPSARLVLCKAVEADGLHFFTNYQSPKARTMEINPHVTATFFWPTLARQVRIEGTVTKLPRQDSEAYFRTRPRGSQIGAWVSQQSHPIADFATLEKEFAQKASEFDGLTEIPCPPHWGGFLLAPSLVEFWLGLPSRLHDRVSVQREFGSSPGPWRKIQLYP